VTLEQLRIFVAVGERQHITHAAHALNLSQSAASAAIAALEEHHGVRLFDRIGRAIKLTEVGRLLLEEAKAVLARATAAELALAEFAGLRRGTLSLQASQTIFSYWLPRYLVMFRRAHPQIKLDVANGNTAQVAAAVRKGVAELGFVEGSVDDPSLSSLVVGRDQLILVVGPEHPWADREQIEPDELATSEWVTREPGSGTRSAFEETLERLGVAPRQLNVALELCSNEAVRAAVEAGMGAAVISASVAAPSLEAGLLHHVRFDLPDRSFQVLHHRERRLSRAADALLALIIGCKKHSGLVVAKQPPRIAGPIARSMNESDQFIRNLLLD
jgi:DNA-binding transcriptional LysR family regulator